MVVSQLANTEIPVTASSRSISVKEQQGSARTSDIQLIVSRLAFGSMTRPL